MKTYKNIYRKICSIENLALACKKARKGKTKKDYVIEFEKNLKENLLLLREELLTFTYKPKPLKGFIIRDPKTRTIHASAFRDRIVHHAIINVIEPIFEKVFIYDSYASRKGKGTHVAIERFAYFMRKVSRNGKLVKDALNKNMIEGYVLKADIKSYFDNVSQDILIQIIQQKVADNQAIGLIRKILDNFESNKNSKGMPLGNLTSQFFANVYLNELDYFVKHNLRAKYYIRYVDDFVILHESREQLKIWGEQIEAFLIKNLKIELHPDKSKIILFSRGVDFVSFRNFYHYRLLRKRNIQNMKRKIELFKQGLMSEEKFLEFLQGWEGYAKWTNCFKLRMKIILESGIFANFQHSKKLYLS